MSDNAFVDSNIWLYAFFLRPGEEQRHENAQALIDTPIRYVINEQVIAEVSSNLLRKASMAEHRIAGVRSFNTSHSRGQVFQYNITTFQHALIPSPIDSLSCSEQRSRDVQGDAIKMNTDKRALP